MTNSDRPYITCHMMQTLDGKIASGVLGTEILMDYFDLYTQIEQNFNSEAWMFGRKTMSAFALAKSEPLPETSIQETKDFIAEHSENTFSITVDIKGLLRWENNFVSLTAQIEKFHIITIVTHQTPQDYLAYLRNKHISYIFCGKEKVDFTVALQKLQHLFGIKNILLEGGGSFNGSLMAAGVIDEISLLLIPRVLNKRNAPSLFNLETNEVATTDYKLVSSEKIERDCLWLRYKKKP